LLSDGKSSSSSCLDRIADEAQAALSLEELADRDWVLYGPDHGLTHLIQTACARAGFVPAATAQTGQVAAAAHLAACSLGVTIVPSNVYHLASTPVYEVSSRHWFVNS